MEGMKWKTALECSRRVVFEVGGSENFIGSNLNRDCGRGPARLHDPKGTGDMASPTWDQAKLIQLSVQLPTQHS